MEQPRLYSQQSWWCGVSHSGQRTTGGASGLPHTRQMASIIEAGPDVGSLVAVDFKAAALAVGEPLHLDGDDTVGVTAIPLLDLRAREVVGDADRLRRQARVELDLRVVREQDVRPLPHLAAR